MEGIEKHQDIYELSSVENLVKEFVSQENTIICVDGLRHCLDLFSKTSEDNNVPDRRLRKMLHFFGSDQLVLETVMIHIYKDVTPTMDVSERARVIHIDEYDTINKEVNKDTMGLIQQMISENDIRHCVKVLVKTKSELRASWKISFEKYNHHHDFFTINGPEQKIFYKAETNRYMKLVETKTLWAVHFLLEKGLEAVALMPKEKVISKNTLDLLKYICKNHGSLENTLMHVISLKNLPINKHDILFPLFEFSSKQEFRYPSYETHRFFNEIGPLTCETFCINSEACIKFTEKGISTSSTTVMYMIDGKKPKRQELFFDKPFMFITMYTQANEKRILDTCMIMNP